jgi:hypothetical protein
MKSYAITPEVHFFDELNTVVAATAAIGMSAELIVSGRVSFQPGDYITIVGLMREIRVRLPLFGPVHAALQDRRPDLIELTVLAGRDQGPNFKHTTGGFRGLLNSLFQPFVVNYYEREVVHVRTKFGSDRTSWPDAWQMGWLVRNAVSHSGGVHFKNAGQKPVVWHGCSISHSDQGKPVMGGVLNQADLIALLIDMEEAAFAPISAREFA